MHAEQKKYIDFEVSDFIKDPYFVAWVKHPTSESKAFWERWMSLHQDRIEILLRAKGLILSFQYKRQDSLTENEIINTYEDIVRIGFNEAHTIQSKPKIKWDRVGIAASILMLFAIGLYFFNNQYNAIENKVVQSPNLEWKESINPNGRKSKITLVDGTVIHLNAASSLKYPKAFNDSIRGVELIGEAFFEVAKDKNKPFIITSGAVKSRVLGTSFNINTKANRENIEIALVEGSLEVKSAAGEIIKMEPLEIINYNKSKERLIKSKRTDLTEFTAWKDGVLVFNKASFKEVCQKLEQWYGVEIIVEKNFITPDKYTGEYRSATLRTVLEGISFTSKFQFSLKDNIVYIKN